jgi:hypothetical protein
MSAMDKMSNKFGENEGDSHEDVKKSKVQSQGDIAKGPYKSAYESSDDE